MSMKDLKIILEDAIDQRTKPPTEPATRKCPSLSARVRVHDLLQAARISIAEADEKNRDLGSTIESLLDLLEDAAGSILEAGELLEEQAEQLL